MRLLNIRFEAARDRYDCVKGHGPKPDRDVITAMCWVDVRVALRRAFLRQKCEDEAQDRVTAGPLLDRIFAHALASFPDASISIPPLFQFDFTSQQTERSHWSLTLTSLPISLFNLLIIIS